MRNMTVGVFAECMKSAINAFHAEQLKIEETSEEYVHEAGELEWLEWFNLFLLEWFNFFLDYDG